MLELTTAEMLQWWGKFWWPLIRLSGAFMIIPLLGNTLIPRRIKVALVVLISAVAMPMMPEMPAVEPLSLQALLFAIEQLVLGYMMGLFLNSLIYILVIVGDILSMQMGLSMAKVNDPINGMSTTVVSTFYSTLATLLFVAQDAHLLALEILIESFRVWPVGKGLLELEFGHIIGLFSWLLASGMLLSLPAMFAMYLVNLTFGLLSKAVPSLNIFSLGFPMAMLCGLMCIYLTLAGIPKNFNLLTHEAFLLMRGLIGK